MWLSSVTGMQGVHCSVQTSRSSIALEGQLESNAHASLVYANIPRTLNNLLLLSLTTAPTIDMVANLFTVEAFNLTPCAVGRMA